MSNILNQIAMRKIFYSLLLCFPVGLLLSCNEQSSKPASETADTSNVQTSQFQPPNSQSKRLAELKDLACEFAQPDVF